MILGGDYLALDKQGICLGHLYLVSFQVIPIPDLVDAVLGSEYAAAIIFNQGNAPGRFELINGTLGGPVGTIPVLDVAYADGVTLSTTTGVGSTSMMT